MQRWTLSSQHDNLDDSTPAELPDINSISVDHHLEGGNPTSNSLASPGLRSVLSADSEGVEKDQTTKGSPSIIKDNNEVAHQASERKKKTHWLFLIIGAIACLIIGLAVGLGVGLTRNRSTTPAKYTPTTAPTTQPSSSGPSPTPNYLSTVGAFNGTGIALASESSGNDENFLDSSGVRVNLGGGYGNVVMYFQHHTGQIREMQLGEDGQWAGGNSTDLVVPAAEVKNGTPITAVSYVFNNISAWHIFYISINNTVQELINNNISDNWAPGPINSLDLGTIDDPHVGLQACWNGYSEPGDNTYTSDQGITLLYGKGSTTFGVASWIASNNTWKQEKDLIDYNGHGGVACFSPFQENGLFLMLVNLQHNLNVLWKDPNVTLTSSETPWIKTNVSIPVFQNTSIGYTDYFLVQDPTPVGIYLFAQGPDLSTVGWKVLLESQNTVVLTNQNTTINSGNGIPGTHLTCQTSSEHVLQLFYQTNGTNIEQFESDLATGWSMLDLPIPAS